METGAAGILRVYLDGRVWVYPKRTALISLLRDLDHHSLREADTDLKPPWRQNDMQIDIEQVTNETRYDFSAVVEDANAWQKKRGSQGWAGPFDDEWMLPRIERGELFLGYNEGVPVSAFRIIWEDHQFWGDREVGDSIYLHTFAVRRTNAGLGVGSSIIRMVADMGRNRGRTKVRLDCFLSNTRLIAFYKRNGFISVGLTSVKGKTMNLMERTI